MKPDITARQDIELLVNTFYEKVNQNETLSPVFNEVAKVDWPHHLPKMYDFWSSLLLGEQTYTSNPMIKHIDLSRQTQMSELQFSTWLKLFTETVNDLFAGEKAEEAISRATNIARLMLHKIQTT